MLCKESTARRVLERAHATGLRISGARTYAIDARVEFGAAVGACLFVVEVGGLARYLCESFSSLAAREPARVFGFVEGKLVSDVELYLRHRSVESEGARWRSGIKHDCAAVMELRRVGGGWVNGLGEKVDVEGRYVFPLLKGTDLARGRAPGERAVIVPQRVPGEDTRALRRSAPRLWAYLSGHREAFERRKSRIYREASPFSIFGVGPYSFAPWKVAVSALHREGEFRLVGPGSVFFDDTCYFLPFETRAGAERALRRLRRPAVRKFLAALVFPDAKRPFTAATLGRIGISRA